MLLHRVGEDAEPGAARPSGEPAGREEAVRGVEVVLGRHDEGETTDLVQVQRHDTDHLAEDVEQRAAPEAGIHGRGHDGAVEHVLPVGVERSDVADRAVGDARRALTDARHDERLLTECEAGETSERQSRESMVRQPHQRQARSEVVVHDLGDVGPLIEERDAHLRRAEDDVVHGEDEAVRTDECAGAHPLGAEDARRRMGLGNLGPDVNRSREDLPHQADGGVHGDAR